MQAATFSALPFPATNAALPETIERSLQRLNGPLRDANNSVYKLAKPLERSRYTACPSCGIKFHMFRRKCNCANCGQVVCADCVREKWYLPKYGLKSPVGCCTMCDRNLQISIKSKEDLGKIPIRELRAYLQLYGLYNPSTMLEKSDLVAAIYNNSPMPQIHEDKYRQSLPQPSEASYTNHAQNSQSTHSPRNRAGLDAQNSSNTGSVNGGSDGSWDRIFTNIGEEMGRAFESIGQQVGSGIERGASVLDEHASSILDPGRQTHRTQPGTNVFTSSNRESNTQNYNRSTYSVPSSNSRRQAQPRTQRSFYTEPRPQATQGSSSDPIRSTTGATTTSARQGRATASAATLAGTRGDAARGSSSPAPQNVIPDIRLLVKDGTDPNTLGVKMLKGILKKNHVDFSNIVEKKELVERVERLVRNTKLEMEREATAAAAASAAAEDSSGGKEKSGGGSDDDVCKICWDASINCVFLNCGHMCTCLECGNRIVESDRRECPICRGHIAKVVHVFRV